MSFARRFLLITAFSLLGVLRAWAGDPFEELLRALPEHSKFDTSSEYNVAFSLGSDADAEVYLVQQLKLRRKWMQKGWRAHNLVTKWGSVTDLALNARLRKHLTEALGRDSSLSAEDRRKTVDTFLKVLDLRGSAGGFSGFPFFKTIREFFKREDVVKALYAVAEAVEAEAARAAGAALLHDRSYVPRDFFSIVQQNFPASFGDQVRLAGILLSRDLSFRHYLTFLPNFSRRKAGLTKAALIPLHVRMIHEADRYVNRVETDRSSFTASVESNIRKNYYFWSGAFLTNELLAAGLSPAVSRRLVASFPIAYKRLRVVQSNLSKIYFGLTLPATLGIAVIETVQGDLKGAVIGGLYALESVIVGLYFSGGFVDWDIRLDSLQVARSSLKGGYFVTQEGPCGMIFNGE